MGPCTVPSAQTCPTRTPAPWRNRVTPGRRSDILSAPPMLAWPSKRQKTIDRLWFCTTKYPPLDGRCYGFSMVPGTILNPYTHIALDAVGRDGCSALWWARARGMHDVAQSLSLQLRVCRGQAGRARSRRCRGRREGANRGLYGQLCDAALGQAVPATGKEILRDRGPRNRTHIAPPMWRCHSIAWEHVFCLRHGPGR